jgi:predicted membrane-bound spermidine synthase
MLSPGSIWIGVLIGTLIPMVSNIMPIKKSLGKNLRNSLDLYHRGSSELQFTMVKLQDLGLSVPQTVMGVQFVVLGIMTFFVAPTSFLF